MPKLQINQNLKQLNINFNIKIKSEYNAKLVLKTTQEKAKTKIILELRG